MNISAERRRGPSADFPLTLSHLQQTEWRLFIEKPSVFFGLFLFP